VHAPDAQPAPAPRPRIGLVTDVDKLQDGTFSRYAYEGMQRAAAEFDLETTVIETDRPEDGEGNILMLVNDGCQLVITIGRQLGEATERLAGDYPTTRFITLDYAPRPALSNVLGVLFAEDQAGFVAGALAAHMTRSKVIGVVAGAREPPVIRFRKGFANGVRYVNSHVKVLGEYVDSFTDPERGRQLAEALVRQGADVIFGVGGQTGSGAIRGAAEQGVWVIGVDRDEWFTTFESGHARGAERLLSSAIKRVDDAVYMSIRSLVAGPSEGKAVVFDTANAGIGLAPYHAAGQIIPEEVKGRIDEIVAGLRRGRLRTGVEPRRDGAAETFWNRLRAWRWTDLAILALAVFTALLIGAVVIWGTRVSDLRSTGQSWADAIAAANTLVLEAYGGLFQGAIGSPEALATSLVYSLPYVCAGLAVALGFQCGLFNIGAEGQVYIGALTGTVVGFSLHGLPNYVHLPLAIAAGILGGSVWAMIPGLLKATTGAHEVINTIMMNYIAVKTVDYLVKNPLRDPSASLDRTPFVAESARYPLLIPQYGLHAGVLVALAAIVFVWWFLFKTTWGFEIRTVGANPSAARYAGISVKRNFVLAMAVSGGLAGLGGIDVILGRPSEYALKAAFSSGFGFDSIAVAMLAKSHPFGIFPAAFLWGALRNGAGLMQVRAQAISIDLINIIQALVIVFIAADQIIRWLYRLRARRQAMVVFTRGWGR
jgi:simple sugar transport system permease protein